VKESRLKQQKLHSIQVQNNTKSKLKNTISQQSHILTNRKAINNRYSLNPTATSQSFDRGNALPKLSIKSKLKTPKNLEMSSLGIGMRKRVMASQPVSPREVEDFEEEGNLRKIYSLI
jgi:hypothetical protein